MQLSCYVPRSPYRQSVEAVRERPRDLPETLGFHRASPCLLAHKAASRLLFRPCPAQHFPLLHPGTRVRHANPRALNRYNS